MTVVMVVDWYTGIQEGEAQTFARQLRFGAMDHDQVWYWYVQKPKYTQYNWYGGFWTYQY